MAEMVELEIGDPFRSKTLVYRSPENNDKDKAFFDSIRKDLGHAIYGNCNVLRPENREASDEAFKDFQKNVLAVFICIPASGADAKTERPTSKGTDVPEVKPSSSADAKDVEEDAGLTPVGFLSLGGGNSGPFDYDHQHRGVWLTISIAKAYRSRGFGREAINWAIDWSFQHAGMHSVGLGCYEYNYRGRHLYESLGFVCGGAYRKDHYFNRKWWDTLIYNILEDEWETRRKEKVDIVQRGSNK